MGDHDDPRKAEQLPHETRRRHIVSGMFIGPPFRCITGLCILNLRLYCRDDKKVRAHTDLYSVLEGDNAVHIPLFRFEGSVPSPVGGKRPTAASLASSLCCVGRSLICMSFGEISMLRVGERWCGSVLQVVSSKSVSARLVNVNQLAQCRFLSPLRKL